MKPLFFENYDEFENYIYETNCSQCGNLSCQYSGESCFDELEAIVFAGGQITQEQIDEVSGAFDTY